MSLSEVKWGVIWRDYCPCSFFQILLWHQNLKTGGPRTFLSHPRSISSPKLFLGRFGRSQVWEHLSVTVWLHMDCVENVEAPTSMELGWDRQLFRFACQVAQNVSILIKCIKILHISSNYEIRFKDNPPPQIMHLYFLLAPDFKVIVLIPTEFSVVTEDRNLFMQLINASWDSYIITGLQTTCIQELARLLWIISFKTEQPLKQAENLIIRLHRSMVQSHLELLWALLIPQSQKIQNITGKYNDRHIQNYTVQNSILKIFKNWKHFWKYGTFNK